MKNFNDPKIKLDKAILHFGSKASLAEFLGLHRVTVTDWVNSDRLTYVPALHAYRMQKTLPDLCGDK